MRQSGQYRSINFGRLPGTAERGDDRRKREGNFKRLIESSKINRHRSGLCVAGGGNLKFQCAVHGDSLIGGHTIAGQRRDLFFVHVGAIGALAGQDVEAITIQERHVVLIRGLQAGSSGAMPLTAPAALETQSIDTFWTVRERDSVKVIEPTADI